jgi:tight adherence protein B
VLALAVALIWPAAAFADELGLQSIDTGSWPRVTMSVTLPASAGEAPPSGVRVWENGAEVTGARIASAVASREAIDVVLVVDVSGSMKGQPLADAQAAAERFASLMGSQDRVALVEFNATAKVLNGFTNDPVVLQTALASLSAAGPTALFDGVTVGVDLFSGSAAPRRAIVILSDGGDTVSATDLNTVVEAARNGHVPLYAVGIQSVGFDPKPLRTMASATGGRLTSVKGSSSLGTIFGALATELNRPYSVTYTSTQPNTPDLEVRVELDGTQVPLSRTVWFGNPAFVNASTPPTTVRPLTAAEESGLLSVRMTIGLLVGSAVALLLGVLGLSLVRRRRPIDDLALYDQLQSQGSESAGERRPSGDAPRSRVLGLLGELAARRGFTRLVRSELERAALPLRPGEFMLMHLGTVVVLGFLTMLISGSAPLTTLAVIVGAAAPAVVLDRLASRRRASFEEQLPAVLMLIAGSLRAGWALPQSIEFVVREASEPVVSEFRRVQAEARLGLPIEQALDRVADRIGSEDFRWTASAIALQREVGGDLSAVLETLAATIRERAELHRQVRSLTAEGRFSAIVLEVMPFAILLLLYVISPDYISPLVTSPLGQMTLGGGLLLLAIGVVWLQRVVHIDV